MEYTAYHEYIFSDKWQFIRKQVLERFNHKCCICKCDGANEVHHVFYRENISETQPGDCVILCHKHHKLFHKHYRVNRSKEHGFSCLESMKRRLGVQNYNQSRIEKRLAKMERKNKNKLSKYQEMILSERNRPKPYGRKRQKKRKKIDQSLVDLNSRDNSVILKIRAKQSHHTGL